MESKAMKEIRDIRDRMYEEFKDKSDEEIVYEINRIAADYMKSKGIKATIIRRLDDVKKAS